MESHLPLSRTTSTSTSSTSTSTAPWQPSSGPKARPSEPEEQLLSPLGTAALAPVHPAVHPAALPAASESLLDYFGRNNGFAVEEELNDATNDATALAAARSPCSLSASEARSRSDVEENRSRHLSFSSLYSLGSAIYANTRGPSWSGRSSLIGSEPDAKMSEPAAPHGTGTTATSSLSVTTQSQHGSLGPKPSPTQLLFPHEQADVQHAPPCSSNPTANSNANPNPGTDSNTVTSPTNPTAASPPPLYPQAPPPFGTGSTAASSSPASIGMREPKKPCRGIIGVCALESKARSKPARNIFGKLVDDFEVKIFGDKIILDEDVENWPVCDFLISFFSDGFPLDKAIAYQVLWDRRLCLSILDKLNVPTPKRIEVNRDGGPKLPSADFAKQLYDRTGVALLGPADGTGGGLPPPKRIEMMDDGDTLFVDGQTLTKPFVEKPDGAGGRRLFRKINNKSSEKDESLAVPRSITEPDTSYIYEQFLQVDNAEDVKAYTVGPTFCHAETRKSPVVDGLVKRNPSGKEVRYVTKLSDTEAAMASKISEGFGQRVCGFDLLRAGDKSYVIDVNGWSFVKDNGDYYDKAANILRDMFLTEIQRKQRKDAAQSAAVDAQDERNGASRKSVSSHRHALKGLFKSPTSPSFEKPDFTAVLGPPTAGTLPPAPASEPDLLPPPAVREEEYMLEPERSRSEDHQAPVPPPASKAQWKLKGVVSVIRHADRTPKQKFKYTFHSQPFVDLLKGHQAEVLLIGEPALQSVSDAVKLALDEKREDPRKLRELQLYLGKKGPWPGTKVQIKPMFRKRRKDEFLPGESPPDESPERQRQGSTSSLLRDAGNESSNETDPERLKNRSDSMSGVTLSRITAQDNNMVLDKLQLIIKWGGEPTHSARHQTQDMGANLRNDLLLMNRDVLDDVHIFSSSERRVTTSAQIFGASFLDKDQYPAEQIHVRKDLLDDSNAAKDVMDKVKKRLKTLLRAGDKAPPQFAWPKDVAEPYIVVRQVVALIKFHQRVMNHNFKKIESEAMSSLSAIASPPAADGAPGQSKHTSVNHIQSRWCCNEGPELFKERWEKLFKEFKDADKVDPSKISELYDTMKFDALHNRPFLEWVFTPDDTFTDDDAIPEPPRQKTSDEPAAAEGKPEIKEGSAEKPHERGSIARRMGFRRPSEIAVKPAVPPSYANESYFKLYTGMGNAASKARMDARLVKLREMYHLCKVLFDYIGPQEYGIESEEKLEIGLLTSLPLLKEIVGDLEELQASDTPKCFFYFTKESHIYTLLNCILEGGIKTKIERNAIPELDYLSQINFELYESENASTDDAPHTFNYSIRITLSPGCHAFAPLDVQLDSRHMIGFSPRRSLTAHQDWKEVLETLRAKFHTVKLPKSFVAIDLSEKEAFERRLNGNGSGSGQTKENLDPEAVERGRSEERRASADADEPSTELPPPALDA
ncbi:acid phosphatase [Ascochyta rabiei]|uniref:Inositol hexakisphosphate and diphosphoinositol-pentakisphosphate kinase n=1 Tax=Didymella rabiei TaxID=5454 RepID=A0A163KGA2_DIDRA|nr:acid phosphatase [Ascochyta rabiei]